MRLAGVIRIGRAYQVGNQVFTEQMRGFFSALKPVLEERQEVVLVALDTDLFLNGFRIPVRTGNMRFHQSVHDEFVQKLDARLKESAIGDPGSTEVLYGPMIHERFAERFEDWLGLIRDHHTVHGSSAQGRITADNPRDGFVGDPDAGIFYHPTIVDGVTLEDEIYRTETFGPIVGVATFSTFDEAMELANNHGYGLSSSIYTTSGTNAFRFRERITAGMVSVNNSTSGAEAHLPFGGNGKSGNGSRQSGIWVLDQFTRWQSMNWDYAGKLQKAQMDVEDVVADLSFRLP